MHTEVLWVKLKTRLHLKDLKRRQKDKNKMDIKPPVHEGVDWIRLAQNGDKWLGLVNVF